MTFHQQTLNASIYLFFFSYLILLTLFRYEIFMSLTFIELISFSKGIVIEESNISKFSIWLQVCFVIALLL